MAINLIAPVSGETTKIAHPLKDRFEEVRSIQNGVPRKKDRVTVLLSPAMVLCNPESPTVQVRSLTRSDWVFIRPMSLISVSTTWQVGDSISAY